MKKHISQRAISWWNAAVWERWSESPVMGSMQLKNRQVLSKRLQGASFSESLGRAQGQILLRPLWPLESRTQSPVIDP